MKIINNHNRHLVKFEWYHCTVNSWSAVGQLVLQNIFSEIPSVTIPLYANKFYLFIYYLNAHGMLYIFLFLL